MPERSARRPAGFSQIEIAFAVVVLSIGILGVFSSFAFGIQAARQGGQMTKAVSWNRQIVELIRVRNLPFTVALPPARSTGLNDPTGLEWKDMTEMNAPPFSNDLPAGTGFRRSLQLRRLSSDPSDYRYSIAEITSTLVWLENGKPRKVVLRALHRQP